MKRYSNILRGLIPVILVLILAGACVKTNPYYTNFNNIQPIAELFLGGPLPNNAYIATQNSATDYTIDVNLASPQPASHDIAVTLALDQDNFTRFNDSVGGTYTLLPANAYTVPSWKVTIPAGQHKASLHIQVNSSLIANSTLSGPVTFMFPVKITDASGTTVSGNYGHGYWIVLKSNPWVGLYHSVGYKKDVGVITNINQDKYLYFADTTSSLGLNGYSGVNTVIGQAGDDVTYIDYGLGFDLTVNPLTNQVTVTTDLNQGGHKQSLQNAGPCFYDPANKVFTLNYSYVNAYGNTDTLHEVLTWKPLPQ